MARTTLTPVTAPGTIDPAVDDLTLAAGDAVNGNDWTIRDGDILIAYNSGASPYDVTLKGAADAQGRSADSVKEVAAGEAAVFGPLKRLGWAQTSGKANIDVENAALELVVLTGA